MTLHRAPRFTLPGLCASALVVHAAAAAAAVAAAAPPVVNAACGPVAGAWDAAYGAVAAYRGIPCVRRTHFPFNVCTPVCVTWPIV